MASLKRLLVGSPIRTARLAHERLTKKTALAIFASDALSSTAYATEQILLVLAAGASLLVDYVLTVSVSVAAGVEAITSAMVGTRFAGLHNHRVWLCLFFIGFITVANLRGVREAGSLFAAPSYAFIFSFLCLIGYGLVRYYLNPGIVPAPNDADLKIAEGYHVQPF